LQNENSMEKHVYHIVCIFVRFSNVYNIVSDMYRRQKGSLVVVVEAPGTMASAERELITGIWGPSGVWGRAPGHRAC